MADRLVKLIRGGETVFKADDLANAWGITDTNTLHVTLYRAVKKGLLYRLAKGVYSILPPDRVDPLMLGARMLHDHTYVSTESVLSEEGYISHVIPAITFVSSRSLKWSVPLAGSEQSYISRQLATRYLYNDTGITTQNGIRKASLYRAIADMLYANPRYHFDRPVDDVKVKAMQRSIGYPITTRR